MIHCNKGDNQMSNQPNIIPVPVIASFDTEGRVMPLYFRYKEHGSIPVTMKSQVKYITYVQFSCECEIDNRIYQVYLIYEWREQKWYVKNMY